MKEKKKSPLKDKPLRYVGQSLDEKIDQIINDDVPPYIMICFFVVYWAGYEWWRYFKHPPPYPVFASIFALIVVTFSGFKIRKSLKNIKALKLGRDGERAVGQYLDDELRGQGHKIYHDIIGDNFNVDHVIISKKGIFAVETKTYSKPETGQPKIYFDGQQLTIDALGKTNKPIIQVIAASKWLKNILQKTTGKEFAVKPILLFPGWFIESTKEGKKSESFN